MGSRECIPHEPQHQAGPINDNLPEISEYDGAEIAALDFDQTSELDDSLTKTLARQIKAEEAIHNGKPRWFPRA